MPRRLAAAITLSTAAVVLLAPPALAHVDLDPQEAVVGSTATLTFTVAFEGSPTTGLEVQVPEGASVSDVPDKAGWTSSVDQAARTVSWTGGTVASDESFSVVVDLPTTPGEVLFPAIQLTADGEVPWISPEEGEGHDTNPAPRLTLVADPSPTTSSTTTTTEATTTTDDEESDLPGTTLEAEERDDGNTAAAPWIIGSGLAALVAIGVGGWILKRRAG
jgi:uncharacterized protein YcnI